MRDTRAGGLLGPYTLRNGADDLEEQLLQRRLYSGASWPARTARRRARGGWEIYRGAGCGTDGEFDGYVSASGKPGDRPEAALYAVGRLVPLSSTCQILLGEWEIRIACLGFAQCFGDGAATV